MPRRKRKSSVRALVLPILPVRNTVLFPHVVTPLFVDRDRSLRAIEESRSEEHTSELQSQSNLVCRLLLEKKKKDFSGFSHSYATVLDTGDVLPSSVSAIRSLVGTA